MRLFACKNKLFANKHYYYYHTTGSRIIYYIIILGGCTAVIIRILAERWQRVRPEFRRSRTPRRERDWNRARRVRTQCIFFLWIYFVSTVRARRRGAHFGFLPIIIIIMFIYDLTVLLDSPRPTGPPTYRRSLFSPAAFRSHTCDTHTRAQWPCVLKRPSWFFPDLSRAPKNL